MKDDEYVGKKGISKGQFASQNTVEVGASGGGEGSKHTNTAMEGVGGVTGMWEKSGLTMGTQPRFKGVEM